ncbi:uncharacterized protein LOC129717770 [Wyeomyia smithii]|uniref:uncharacterized protein LOC129717770 n=1 Tax=Wyeomyia smithii TaxID=174621 RepID=UPI002467DC6D|nr:uncharacterized protein LOC129717770 [Wyeomyia smithii]
MSECYYGLTQRDVRSLAFELAEMNQISHPFSQSEKLAGYDWLKCFLKRHPNLSLRSAENTSLARATGFNRHSVRKYFDLLEGIFADHQYPPQRIWNMDETGFSTVYTKLPKVLAKKGQHQMGAISSSERGVNTTVVLAMSASGAYLPPMFIFARHRMNDALKVGAPEGSVFTCNPSGWSTLTTCSSWFDHFLSHTRPSVDSPVLLILDGHSTHTRNLQMLEKAKKNFVRIISIPPHTSHKVQPLDVALMGPLKSHYATANGNFLKKNPGKTITAYNVCELVNHAFVKSANMSSAQNGFRATGIYPFNPSVFNDSDFAVADSLTLIMKKKKLSGHKGATELASC